MYRIKFFKTLLSSDGHCFKCLQDVIDVSHADSEGDALEAAKQAFRQKQGHDDWHVFADSIEVECEPNTRGSAPTL
jgi:hypothetical protein